MSTDDKYHFLMIMSIYPVCAPLAEIRKRLDKTLREHRQRSVHSQEKLAAKAGINRTYWRGRNGGRELSRA
jgi:hypothetical protein